MGETAAHTLVDRPEENWNHPSNIAIEPELLIRESTRSWYLEIKLTSSWIFRDLFLPVDFAIFHDEHGPFQLAYILQRIAFHSNQVSELAGFNGP